MIYYNSSILSDYLPSVLNFEFHFNTFHELDKLCLDLKEKQVYLIFYSKPQSFFYNKIISKEYKNDFAKALYENKSKKMIKVNLDHQKYATLLYLLSNEYLNLCIYGNYEDKFYQISRNLYKTNKITSKIEESSSRAVISGDQKIKFFKGSFVDSLNQTFEENKIEDFKYIESLDEL